MQIMLAGKAGDSEHFVTNQTETAIEVWNGPAKGERPKFHVSGVQGFNLFFK